VDGLGPKGTEDDYLPHVIQCENGGANLEALKAQAIAARSVAYYNMADSGSICDGQGCQVYSCGATPSAIHYQAVQETAGQYLLYANMLTYGFYVAGDNGVSPPSCVGSSGTTEHWITYNEGKTGTAVEQTELGYVGPPGFGQNRGCMGQWSARCLENSNGYDYLHILRFFYGDDIGILTAPGPCVTPTEPTLDAAFVSQGSDADPPGAADHDYTVCTGATFHFWFELENTGTADWVDLGAGASATGEAVRLGVPNDGTDPLLGASRISVNENANNDVRSTGDDAPTCRHTRFTSGAGIEATAPTTPGMVTTAWRLVDEGNAWFGPELSLTFRVIDCGSGTGGAAGQAGAAGSGGAGGEAGEGGQGGTAGSWPNADGGSTGGSSNRPYAYQSEEPEGCACSALGRSTRTSSAWWIPVVLAALGLRRRQGSLRAR
jgi:hypothetical protein